MFHPMTGKPTKLKIHFAWDNPYWYGGFKFKNMRAACGTHITDKLIGTRNVNQVTCLVCLAEITKPGTEYFNAYSS